MGGAAGGLEAHFLPNYGVGFWPLISMAAVLGGAMGSPLMAVVFAFELTHDPGILLPLLISALVSYGFVVLTLPRSILTEKLSRRGYHLSREYSVDPMEGLFVKDAMETGMKTISPDATILEAQRALQVETGKDVQRLFPVIGTEGNMVGVVPRWDLEQFAAGKKGDSIRGLVHEHPMIAYADEPLRLVVHRMASSGLTKFPVVERSAPSKPVGMIALIDMLKARVATMESEERREQLLRFGFPLLFRSKDVTTTPE